MEYAKFKVLAGAAILLTTLGFGLYPFNFFSRNDVVFDPDIPGLRFHSNAHEKGYSQQGIVFTEERVRFPQNQPTTLLIEAIPSKIPDGLGTIIEFHDGLKQPPLIVAQWRNHLAIRSRRLSSTTGRSYQEIGLSNCLQLGKLVSLLINYNGSDTRIFLNGQIAATKRGYHLLDRDFPLNAHLTIGNNPTGERGWTGALKRIAIYSESVIPHEIGDSNKTPFIEYIFDKPHSGRIPNVTGSGHSLRSPNRFEPLEPKRFAALSSFNEREDWQSSDISINFFGFIPLSVVLFFTLSRLTRIRWVTPIFTTVGAFTISWIIEFSQIKLPSRSPSYVDLLVNTLAGLSTGLALFLILRKRERKRLPTRLTLPKD